LSMFSVSFWRKAFIIQHPTRGYLVQCPLAGHKCLGGIIHYTISKNTF
jgi:hypothetical protein